MWASQPQSPLHTEPRASPPPHERCLPASPAAHPPLAPATPFLQLRFSELVEFLPRKLAALAGVPDADTAAERLRRQPMFCMETCVRLFYWMRLACERGWGGLFWGAAWIIAAGTACSPGAAALLWPSRALTPNPDHSLPFPPSLFCRPRRGRPDPLLCERADRAGAVRPDPL